MELPGMGPSPESFEHSHLLHLSWDIETWLAGNRQANSHLSHK